MPDASGLDDVIRLACRCGWRGEHIEAARSLHFGGKVERFGCPRCGEQLMGVVGPGLTIEAAVEALAEEEPPSQLLASVVYSLAISAQERSGQPYALG